MIIGCTSCDNFLDFSGFKTIETQGLKLGCQSGSDSEIFQDENLHLICIAQGRVDNQQELQTFTGKCQSSPEYLWKAFLLYGKKCVSHIKGDWLIVIFNKQSGELFIARDQVGRGGLFYRQTPDGFCFATSIHELTKGPKELNTRYALGILSRWKYTNQVQETLFKNVFSLAPGFMLTYVDGRLTVERYWHPEKIPLRYYKSTRDYADELLEITKEAIRCRIPENLKVGTMLSGGYDSGTVTSLTAEILGEAPLMTFSHVPLYNQFYEKFPRKFNDETEHINAVVASRPNIRSFLLKSPHISPIEGIEKYVKYYNTIIPNAANAFWLVDINEQAYNSGVEVLFSASMGNATISYAGLVNLLDMPLGWPMLKHKILKPLFTNFLEYYYFRESLKWGFLNPALLSEHKVHADVLLNRNSLRTTYASKPEYTLSFQRISDFVRLIETDPLNTVRKMDPTDDISIIEYCLSIPNEVFFNEKGENKQLIRHMMAGRLPDMVLHEKRKGQQASDIFMRVLADIDRIDECFRRFEKNPAFRHFFDTDKMKNTLALIRAKQQDNPIVLNSVLASLMMGIFMEQNGF